MSYHFLLKHVSRGFGWPSYQQVFRWMSPLSDKNITTLLNKDFIPAYDTEKTWNNFLYNQENFSLKVYLFVTVIL